MRKIGFGVWCLLLAGACATAGVPGGEPDARVAGPGGGSGNSVDASLVPDATRLPDAALPDAALPDAACSVVQVLQNADFDQGPGGGWVQESEYQLITPASSLPLDPHSGGYAAWMGGVTGLYEMLGQSVTIPSGAVDVRVSGYLWVVSAETGGVARDTLVLTLREPGGGTLESLRTFSNLDSGGGWAEFSVPVAGVYAGRSVRVQFESYNGSDAATSFYLDTLAVGATVCQ